MPFSPPLVIFVLCYIFNWVNYSIQQVSQRAFLTPRRANFCFCATLDEIINKRRSRPCRYVILQAVSSLVSSLVMTYAPVCAIVKGRFVSSALDFINVLIRTRVCINPKQRPRVLHIYFLK